MSDSDLDKLAEAVDTAREATRALGYRLKEHAHGADELKQLRKNLQQYAEANRSTRIRRDELAMALVKYQDPELLEPERGRHFPYDLEYSWDGLEKRVQRLMDEHAEAVRNYNRVKVLAQLAVGEKPGEAILAHVATLETKE